jgi:hypothetical protein
LAQLQGVRGLAAGYYQAVRVGEQREVGVARPFRAVSHLWAIAYLLQRRPENVSNGDVERVRRVIRLCRGWIRHRLHEQRSEHLLRKHTPTRSSLTRGECGSPITVDGAAQQVSRVPGRRRG